MARFLYWAPRLLGILLAAFVSLFALDVFDSGEGMANMIAGLLIHLIPVYAIVAALIIGWRWELAGAVLFAALALAYPIVFGTDFHWSAYLVLMGPALIIAALFLASWLRKRQAATA